MNEKKLIIFILFLIFPFYIWKIFFSFPFASVNAAAKIEATIRMTICGNNIKEVGEDCDTTDLTGKNCQNFGYSQGSLSCTPSCDFNFSSCTRGNTSNTGGSGLSIVNAPVETKIILSGKAYPHSNIILLKDGQIAITTIADSRANFNLQLSGLSTGNYIFSIYGEDNKGVTSSTFVFPIRITQGATTTIDNIFIAPTISIDKDKVKLGDNLVIFGQTAPKNDITIITNSENEILSKTKADNNGVYLYNFDTSLLEKGDHYVKSKVNSSAEINYYSKSIKFVVGNSSASISPQKISKSDLNNDNRINLVDFSIAAYWYKKPLSQKFTIIEKEMLNGDGKIDLVDFSVMAFYWKG